MSELKTQPNEADVQAFIESIEDESRRNDCRLLIEMLRELTGEEPVMWGDKLIGFGTYRYRYSTGREGDWFRAGFSPRKRDVSIYVMSGLDEHQELLEKLGPHKRGKGCLWIKHLDDVDQAVLREIILRSLANPMSASG